MRERRTSPPPPRGAGLGVGGQRLDWTLSFLLSAKRTVRPPTPNPAPRGGGESGSREAYDNG